MPPQKSIASFFTRTAPKPASGEALASSPAQPQQTAKAKAAAGSSKELVAAAKAAPADQVGECGCTRLCKGHAAAWERPRAARLSSMQHACSHAIQQGSCAPCSLSSVSL